MYKHIMKFPKVSFLHVIVLAMLVSITSQVVLFVVALNRQNNSWRWSTVRWTEVILLVQSIYTHIVLAIALVALYRGQLQRLAWILFFLLLVRIVLQQIVVVLSIFGPEGERWNQAMSLLQQYAHRDILS